MSSTPMVRLEAVSKRFDAVPVLCGIHAEVRCGEVVVVCGPSGSGKSTLVRTINRLEAIDGGRIMVEGLDIHACGVDINRLRARIGFVFQHYNLFPHLSCRDNVAIALHRVGRMKRDAAREKATALLTRIGLGHRLGHMPPMLSGGERQRVAICRAIANDPALILFDEPTSALDPEMVGEVLTLIRMLARQGITMVCVTHEMGFAREVADTVWFLDHGALIETAPPHAFFAAPRHPRVRQFLSYPPDQPKLSPEPVK